MEHWTPYQEFIYKRTYARWIEEEKRREDWSDTVRRYEAFFIERVPKEYRSQFKEATDAILKIQVMPSMRALWSAGPALEKEGCTNYNCSYLQLDYPKAFAELLYILMCGTGVGFSVERQYINKLPTVPSKIEKSNDIVVFADSRRGWAEGYYKIMKALWQGKDLNYDLSKIRPKGARLKTMGGRSSGPDPLADLIEFTKKVFYNAQGRKLNSLECFDIACMIASCVVVGGVRRSACIALSNLSDDRMAKAKSGQFYEQTPYRAFANISTAYTEKPSSRKFLSEWLKLVESKSGERGIFNREAAKIKVASSGRRIPGYEWGTNPCFTGDMRILTIDGYKRFDELEGKQVKLVGADGNIYEGKIWKTGRKKVVDVIFAPAAQGQKCITCTPDHIFQLIDGTSCEAKDLANRKVRGFYNDSYFVISVKERKEEKDVYDFSMSDLHWGIVEGVVVHNCGEIILRPNEFCNLSEVIVRPNDNLNELKEKVKLATILGIIQSTVTNFNFITSTWLKNCEEERLLGVSLTGLRDHNILGLPTKEAEKWLKEMKQVAIEEAIKWAKILKVEIPAGITCIKPSGTVSALCNTASGLHPRFSRYYIRRVQVNAIDPIAKLMIDQGMKPYPVDNQGNIIAFEFPTESPQDSIVAEDLSAIDQLKYWLMLREYWCEHNPSCTVYVKDEEWPEVGAWVYKHWDQICGITFVPYQDHVYHLAPYEKITKEKYDEMVKNMPKLDFSKLNEYEESDNTEGAREFACTANGCEI